MNRLVYLVKRLLLGLPVVLFGVTMTFLILYLGPLDPVNTILGRDATPEDVRQLRIALGYIYPNGDPVPLWDQYLMTMRDLFTFNFGNSWVIQRNTSVVSLIAARMPATLWLGWWSVVIALVIGIPAGLFAGLRSNTMSDYLTSGGGILWRAMPNFWLAVMIAGSLTAGGAFSWYRDFGPSTDVIGTSDALGAMLGPSPFAGIPVLGMIPDPNLGNILTAFKWILPAALVLGSASMGNEIRIGRTAVMESKNSKYVETAKAKGLASRRIILKHVGRNALIPLLPVIMGEFYLLIGGALLVELVFAINGLGSMFLRATIGADVPMVMALAFIFVIITVAFNIVQDLLYTVVDPRISLEATER